MNEREPRGLGALADPRQFTEPLRLNGQPPQTLRRQLRTMLLIRYVEEALAEMLVAGQVVTPCHLGIGQEAVSVGVAESLNAQDRVFGTHRAHGQYLAMGGDPCALIAEVLTKPQPVAADGKSGGGGEAKGETGPAASLRKLLGGRPR